MNESSALLASARAWLEWEEDLGATGIPADLVRAAAREPVEVPVPLVEASSLRDASAASTRLSIVAEQVRSCIQCDLSRARQQAVFSRGSLSARVVFVGDSPSEDDERQGRPFVGDAGELLDKMIAAMGLSDASVYICNLVKCRPPANRPARPEEIVACSGHLRAQLETVRPEVLVALGESAARSLGAGVAPGTEWRGQWYQWEGISVMPTYHPAFLLQSPALKREAWADLQKVMAKLQLLPPSRARGD